MRIRKGDLVKVISGKDRGKTGKVQAVLRKENKVFVEKVNIVKKHKKQTGGQKDPGGIIEIELPIDSSNVMVICSSCNKPTRIGFAIEREGKVRVCKKCNAKLD